MDIFIITKIGDNEESREKVENPTPTNLEIISKDIAAFNDRQKRLRDMGALKQPKVKLLISN